MSVKIEKRENFDAITERETISIQNIDFLDVAIDVADEIKENEISMIDFDEFVNDVNINVDSFVDADVANDVDVSMIVIVTSSLDVVLTISTFDVEREIIDANAAIDVDIAISSANLISFF